MKLAISGPHDQHKRHLDVLLSLAALMFFLPLILVSIVLIFTLYRKNPFFIQERIGLGEKPFKIIKLRTLFSEEDRLLVRLGLFLRKYSIDELPQLINVLLGDMSLIGPRPLLPEYLPYYNEQERRRHMIRPGITGMAQINGRNSLTWKEKFTSDVWYVDNASLALDLKIMAATVLHLLNTEHVKPEGLTEEEKFKGNSYCY